MGKVKVENWNKANKNIVFPKALNLLAIEQLTLSTNARLGQTVSLFLYEYNEIFKTSMV